MKKILVTGATGFVGKAVIEELTKTGFEIYACAKSENAGLPNYFSVDITSAESIAELSRKLPQKLPKIDCIIHSAGLAHQFKAPDDPDIFNKVNVEGTRNVANLAASLGCGKFILVSSISVYGDGKPNPTGEEVLCEPSGAYAVSKYEGELAAREVCEKSGIDLTILRLATVYGPGDVGNVLRLIKLIDGGKFFWTGDGKNSKSLIFVEDAARACRIAAEGAEKDPAGANIYNVTDTQHTMREIVETIAAELGKKIPGFRVPAGVIKTTLGAAGLVPVVGKRARGLEAALKKWQSDDVLSGEKIERELNFKPETSLAAGIAKEVQWYRDKK